MSQEQARYITDEGTLFTLGTSSKKRGRGGGRRGRFFVLWTGSGFDGRDCRCDGLLAVVDRGKLVIA